MAGEVLSCCELEEVWWVYGGGRGAGGGWGEGENGRGGMNTLCSVCLSSDFTWLAFVSLARQVRCLLIPQEC